MAGHAFELGARQSAYGKQGECCLAGTGLIHLDYPGFSLSKSRLTIVAVAAQTTTNFNVGVLQTRECPGRFVTVRQSLQSRYNSGKR